MKSSLTSVTFNAKPMEEIVSLAKQAGLQAIEWGAKTHVPAGDTESAKTALRLCQKEGLAVSGYGTYYYGLPGEDFAPVLECAKALKTPVIRVWAGKGFSESSLFPSDLRKTITENLKNAALAAKEYGITVATEYHAFSLTDNFDSTVRLLEDAPDLRTYWQPRTHPVQGVQKDLQDIACLGEKIVNTHALCWLDGSSQPLELWQDAWTQYIPALRKYTAAGHAAIELVAGNAVEQFFADAKVLKTVLNEI